MNQADTKPIEGAFFRMSFRHFLQTRGYSRGQAKAMVDGLKWDAAKEKMATHGPNLLAIFKAFEFDDSPTMSIDHQPADSDFNIDLPNWENLWKSKNEPNVASSSASDPSRNADPTQET